MRAVLLAVLILLSGCLWGADTDPRDDPPSDTDGGSGGGTGGTDGTDSPPVGGDIVLLSDFGFQDCEGIEAQVLVEAEAAQALLPDNYTISTGQGPAQHPAQALARWRILSCPTFTSPSTSLNETVYGDVALAIDHPGFGEQGEQAWYRFQIFSADDNLAAAWQVAGYEVVTGDVQASSGTLPGQRTYSFASYAAEIFPITTGSVPAEEVIFTETAAAPLVWGEVIDGSVQQGTGTFSVPSSDPLSSLLSPDPTRQTLLLHDGTSIAEARLVYARL